MRPSHHPVRSPHTRRAHAHAPDLAPAHRRLSLGRLAVAPLLLGLAVGCGSGSAQDATPDESGARAKLDPYQLVPEGLPVSDAARQEIVEFIELMQPLDPTLTSNFHDQQFWKIKATVERLEKSAPEIGWAALHAFTNLKGRNFNIKRNLLRVGAHASPEEAKGLLEALTMTYGFPIEDRTAACMLWAEVDPDRYIAAMESRVLRDGAMLHETMPDDEFLVKGWKIAHERAGISPVPSMSRIAMDLMMQPYARIIAIRTLGEHPLTPESRGALQACLIESLGDGFVRRVAAQAILAQYPREDACSLFRDVRANEADPNMVLFLEDLILENCR